MTSLIVIALLSYLIGSIPTSILAARLLRGIDIRKHGSGNAGATNVFRVLGTGPGIAVMLIDLLKGVAAVGIG
ncbi:MAG: glycerol-3-phosphate acyltransferase, partial [Rhodothermales bacterium]|nr:glycerol-3-phosphate acyltransferase [Rhodothermales bacterium]